MLYFAYNYNSNMRCRFRAIYHLSSWFDPKQVLCCVGKQKSERL